MKILGMMIAVALLAPGCAQDDGGTDADARPLPWFGRTRGGAVVLSRDERIAVATFRSAGVVEVLALDPDAELDALVTRRTELDLGEGSEPWAAVISGDGNTAYVILRHDQAVVRIAELRGRPTLDGKVTTGSEPTAIALTPSGKRLFVANWGEGTVSVITTPDFAARAELDLNRALVDTGALGAVAPRLGLAHPRALALTDDGDDEDGDETLYVTEFFSMPLADAGPPDEPGYFDRNRQGLVYPIPLSDRLGQVGEPITLGPVSDTGLADVNGAPTGCFPNQLYAAAAEGTRVFVTSVCASPAGPLGPAPAGAAPNPANFKTVLHSALFAIDTGTQRELAGERRLLNAELEQRYAEDGASELRMPLIPNDIALTAPDADVAGRRSRCITALGADAVFCLRPDGEIGSPGHRYVDLAPRDQAAARLPIGLALSQRRHFGLVVSDGSQTLSVIDLDSGRVRKREEPLALPRAVAVGRAPASSGRQLFATGLDAWSFGGQARVSCEGCHPDGLSDGVTWFFSRGPRRTISTAGTYADDGQQRVLLWTANVDEVHDVEGIVRSVAGGVGGVLWNYPAGTPTNDLRIVYDGSPATTAGKPTRILHQNLNASVRELLRDPAGEEPPCTADSTSCESTPVHEWDELDAFIRSVRAPLRPAGLDAAQVERGAELFRLGRCAGCHGGPSWTLSRVFYTRGQVNNGALPYQRPSEITDQQLGLLRTERYQVPESMRRLNPPGASGSASFRRWDLPLGRDRVVHLYGNGSEADSGYDARTTHGNDQINCVLRDVGTFPTQSGNALGIVPQDSPTAVRELRDNMKSLALGATGFNIPALVGVAAGAPYLHAGNARSLEELFAPAFAAHHQALATGFLAGDDREKRAGEVDDLVAYLLSIDDLTPSEGPEPDDDLCVATPAIH